MLLQRINRTSPEKIYTSVLIEEANGVVEGDTVKWSTTGSASYPLGVAVIKVAADNTDLLTCGTIWNSGKTDTVVKDDYALMQVYGVHSNVKITGALAAAGLPVTCSVTAGTAKAGAVGDDPSARLGVSLAAVSGGRASIFIQKL